MTSHISTLFPTIERPVPKPHSPRSEREELLSKFLDRLNAERAGTTFKPLQARSLGVKLAHIPTGDLWAFYRQCEAARSFSRYFWWAIKPKEAVVDAQHVGSN